VGCNTEVFVCGCSQSASFFGVRRGGGDQRAYLDQLSIRVL
jgi:hypothetical protein